MIHWPKPYKTIALLEKYNPNVSEYFQIIY